MYLQEKLPWSDPLEFAAGIVDKEQFLAFLYSGMEMDSTGQYSLLAVNNRHQIISDDFSKLAKTMSADKNKYENAWFGYLGYDLKNKLENVPEDAKGIINLPNLWMINFGTIFLFDHNQKIIEIWADSTDYKKYINRPYHKINSPKTVTVKSLLSNMTKIEYLEKVAAIKDAIERGDLYQANLTRKFFGELEESPETYILFTKLCKISSSPYSAYIRLGEYCIISSSPEMFLKIDREGKAESRPIKGTAPRDIDKETDKKLKEGLSNSEKDKAENLMIVDLMRNDFSRSCIDGSVDVEKLFEITSYSTIHHMFSIIKGTKKPEISTIDFIKNCFPPGSMTGTPKIKAMEICSQLEKTRRGVYSGALGWFGGDGSTELSVVIRTIILH